MPSLDVGTRHDEVARPAKTTGVPQMRYVVQVIHPDGRVVEVSTGLAASAAG